MRKSLVYSLVGIIAVAVISLGATIASGNKPLLGLDLQGGASLVLKPQQKVDNGVLDQAISIIRKRVDALGVAEPDISRQGNTVVIELPGIKNPQDALNTVGQTAELRFRPMLCNVGALRRATGGNHAVDGGAYGDHGARRPRRRPPPPRPRRRPSRLRAPGSDRSEATTPSTPSWPSASRPIAAGPGLDTQATTATPRRRRPPATTATDDPRRRRDHADHRRSFGGDDAGVDHRPSTTPTRAR